jgi:hypothetical protein
MTLFFEARSHGSGIFPGRYGTNISEMFEKTGRDSSNFDFLNPDKSPSVRARLLEISTYGEATFMDPKIECRKRDFIEIHLCLKQSFE